MYNKLAVEIPYPLIDKIMPNAHDLKLVKQDYAGIISETSAISQYFYHSIQLEHQGYNEYAKILMAISEVEMKHLSIIGKLILKLGGDPTFVSNCTPNRNYMTWWTGDYVDYSKNLCKIILQDIASEKATIKLYKRHAEQVCCEQVSAVLNRIILDEELHIEVLTEMLRGISE